MEALVKSQIGKGFLEIREASKPKIRANEVLISIKAAGICGTDLHIEEGGFPCNPPVTIGHEFSGEIVEVGGDVKRFKPKDRVVAEPHKGGCGSCRYCLTGQVEVCREKKAIGYRVDGCFAPYLALPVFSLHRIPDDVPYQHAALTEPLAVVVKAVLERSRVEPEDFVVVLGCGPIGLLAAAAVKAEGARTVMITGTNRDEQLRLATAREMNIDYVVNVQKEDLVKTVNELTEGIGADLVIEASGSEPAIRQAFDIVRIDGRITGLGITGEESISVPWDAALKKSAQLMWSLSSTWTSWERALSLMSTRKVEVDRLITRTFPLKDWKKAFGLLRNLEAIKILLTP
jgi:L-iditol 2-dehydrogenase